MHIHWSGARFAGVILAVWGAVLGSQSAFADMAGMGLSGLRLSEIRVDQQGADADEYFEIAGSSGASLNGWWFVAIGDSASDSGGIVEMAVNLSAYSLGGNGYFVGHEASFGGTVFEDRTLNIDAAASHAAFGTGDSLNFENSDNVTYMLVRSYTGTVGVDLDTNNDGLLDATPWVELADSVAFLATSSTDLVYSATRVGPIALSGTGGMPPHAAWTGMNWEIGGYSSWSLDSPGTGSAVPGPGAPVVATIAAMIGSVGYHRSRRRL